MNGSGFLNGESYSWSLVKHCHPDICITTPETARHCFQMKWRVGVIMKTIDCVRVCVLVCSLTLSLTLSQAQKEKKETKMKQMGGGGHLDCGSFYLTCVTVAFKWRSNQYAPYPLQVLILLLMLLCSVGAVMKWKHTFKHFQCNDHMDSTPYISPSAANSYSSISGHSDAGPEVYICSLQTDIVKVNWRQITHLTCIWFVLIMSAQKRNGL